MQGIDPTIIVLLVLSLVAAAAVVFRPAGYTGSWKLLAESFESKNRPSFPKYRNENILVDDYAQFDAEIDDGFFWLLYDGPNPKKCSPCLRIPWDKIIFIKNTDSQYLFEVETTKPVRMMTGKEIGEAIMRRVGRAEDKSE